MRHATFWLKHSYVEMTFSVAGTRYKYVFLSTPTQSFLCDGCSVPSITSILQTIRLPQSGVSAQLAAADNAGCNVRSPDFAPSATKVKESAASVLHCDVFVDPSHVVGHVGEDAGILRVSAESAPTRHSNQRPRSVDQRLRWTPRVSLRITNCRQMGVPRQ